MTCQNAVDEDVCVHAAGCHVWYVAALPSKFTTTSATPDQQLSGFIPGLRMTVPPC